MGNEMMTELDQAFYRVDTNLWNPLARITPERVENSFVYSSSSVVPDVSLIKELVESYCYDYKLPNKTN